MQMTKMVRKQVKGINKQVRHLNKDISRNISGLGRNLGHTRSRGAGMGLFTGLLILSVPVVAVAVLLSKSENREKVSKFVGTVKESQEPMLGQIQTRFGSLLEQFGFAKRETTEEAQSPKSSKNGKNGKNGQKEAETATSGNIQTMGEV